MKNKNYKTYHIISIRKKNGGEIRINFLMKKTFFEKHYWKIIGVLFLVLTIYKIYVGDFVL